MNKKDNNMETRQAYDKWSDIYDTNINKTRDLEARAIKEVLSEISFKRCLELGCGTGKNTQWLITRAEEVVSVDFSEAMLLKAKQKLNTNKVSFYQADITQDWTFLTGNVDLICFSLVLEHIEDLTEIFRKASLSLTRGGHVYLGELHPFKQYSGTKARFETENGTQVVPCFDHHVSDFTQAAAQNAFEIIDLREYFDEDGRSAMPRILSLLFRKTNG